MLRARFMNAPLMILPLAIGPSVHAGAPDLHTPIFSTPLPTNAANATYAAPSATADFNADGHADVISVGRLCFGRGDGSFQPPIAFLVPQASEYDVVVADLNDDDSPDAVVGARSDGALSIVVLVNDGAGHFAITTYTLADPPATHDLPVLVADVTGDGAPDIVADWSASLGTGVLVNNTDGTFATPSIPAGADAMLAVRLNADNVADVVSWDDTTVTIALSNADGTFTPSQTLDAMVPWDGPVCAADLDADNDIDLVLPEPTRFTILRNDGDGHFAAETYVHEAGERIDLAPLDPGDSPDMVFSNAGGLATLLNVAGGRFDAPRAYPESPSNAAAAIADVNADDHPDLLIFSRVYAGAPFGMRLNNGDGLLGPELPVDVHPERPAGPNEYVSAAAGADLDADGAADLLVLDVLDRTAGPVELRVLFGGVPPTHIGVVPLPTESYGSDYLPPLAILTADLDNDADTDVVLIDYLLLVYHNDGAGHLSLVQNRLIDANPGSGLLADVNSDGYPDLVVAKNNTVLVSPGLADGTFAGAVEYSYGLSINDQLDSLVAADVTGDGAADLIASQGYDILVLANDGDGAFPAVTQTIPTDSYAHLAAADADQDGDIDVWANTQSGSFMDYESGLDLLVNDGTGTLTPVHVAQTGAGAFVLVADMNADSIPDVVSGLGYKIPYITVFNGRPGATLNVVAGSEERSGWPYNPFLRDLDGDGITDLFASRYHSGHSAFRSGNNDGTFAPSALTYLGFERGATAAADFDEDGRLDLLGAGPRLLLASNTPERFDAFNSYMPLGDLRKILADVNEDGHPDLIVSNWIVGTIQVYTGDALGDFTLAETLDSPVAPLALDVADVTGDGLPDIIAQDLYADGDHGTIRVLRNLGNAHFTLAWTADVPDVYQFAHADLNRDGRIDLVASVVYLLGPPVGENVYVLTNDSGHAFDVTTLTPSADPGNNPATQALLGDIDGDGAIDMLVGANSTPGTLYLYFNNGDGTFAPPTTLSDPARLDEFTLADVTGDARADLISSTGYAVSLRRGRADRTFGPVEPIASGLNAGHLQIGDVTGDARPDIACTWGGITVFRALGDGAFAPPETYATTLASNGYGYVHLIDINADGALDAAAYDDWGTADFDISLNRLPAAPVPCPGDFDHSGATDIADFATLAINFGHTVPPGTNGDANADGLVNIFDVGILASNLGCSR